MSNTLLLASVPSLTFKVLNFFSLSFSTVAFQKLIGLLSL